MKKLLYTDNIGFDMTDWEKIKIRKVFAGTDCIMAITDAGDVLQKTVQPSVAARTEYWTRITEIACSKWAPGMAIGLVSDGTCMIAKRAVRACDREGRFDTINDQVKSWRNILQVAASDAFFGLDKAGKIHCAPLFRSGIDEYREIAEWENVKKIATGNQNSVFAVTADGKVYAAGQSCRKGPHGDLSKYLSAIEGAVDVFPTGSECESVFMLLKDGTIINLYGEEVSQLSMPLTTGDKVLDGTFSHFVLAHDKKRLINLCAGGAEILNTRSGRIVSFAAGDIHYVEPFAIAVAEWDD